jgi:hypothetical protein
MNYWKPYGNIRIEEGKEGEMGILLNLQPSPLDKGITFINLGIRVIHKPNQTEN